MRLVDHIVKFGKSLNDAVNPFVRREKKKARLTAEREKRRAARFELATGVLDRTLDGIDGNAAEGWKQTIPKDAFADLAEICETFTEGDMQIDAERTARIAVAAEKTVAANRPYYRVDFDFDTFTERTFDWQDMQSIATLVPVTANLWRKYPEDFNFYDQTAVENMAELTPAKDRRKGIVSNQGDIYTGPVMGPRDSFPIAVLVWNEDKTTDVEFIVGCFEGNGVELTERVLECHDDHEVHCQTYLTFIAAAPEILHASARRYRGPYVPQYKRDMPVPENWALQDPQI